MTDPDMHCPLCKSLNCETFYDWGYGLPANKIPVKNVICRHCGLVSLAHKPKFINLKNYYQAYTQINQPSVREIPIAFEDQILGIARLRLEHLRDFLHASGRILDVGCSFGALLKVIRDQSGLPLDVVGVNPEPELAIFGREKYDLDIRIGMFEDQKFEEASFDMILLDAVIEHFESPTKILETLHKVLRPEGLIYIMTIDVNMFNGFPWQIFFPDHIVTYSQNTLRMQLESTGFTVLQIDSNGHVTHEGYHYPYMSCIAKRVSEIPASYDFSCFRDDPDLVRSRLESYTEEFMKDTPAAKRLFEARFEGRSEEELQLLEENFRLSGEPEYVPANFTQPPEDFFVRRVILGNVHDESDRSLALNLMDASGLNPEFLLLQPSQDKCLDISAATAAIRAVNLPKSFRSIDEAWSFLENVFPKIDERYDLHLKKADLPKDTLARFARKVRDRGFSTAVANYMHFTDARIEMCRMKSDGEPRIVGPDIEDCRYFVKTNYDKYYSCPKFIALDLYPKCNKQCIKCKWNSPESEYAKLLKNAQPMPLDMALRLIDEAAAMDPKPSFAPFGSGEPLLYPHLEKVLRYAKDNGLVVSMTSNGLLLDEKCSRMLLDVGIDFMFFSLDAVREETYKRLQPPGNLARVRENIMRFIEMRKEPNKPSILIRYVMDESNHEEFEDFLSFWQKKVDTIVCTIRMDQFGKGHAMLPLFTKPLEMIPCLSAWTTMNIRWNGDVTSCVLNYKGAIGLSVREKSILEAWNAPEYHAWRNSLLIRNSEMRRRYCKACPDWSSILRYDAVRGGRNVTVTPVHLSYSRS